MDLYNYLVKREEKLYNKMLRLHKELGMDSREYIVCASKWAEVYDTVMIFKAGGKKND